MNRIRVRRAPSAEPTDATSVAKVNPLGQKLAIKFVERSGAENHELLAGGGMEHRLFYWGLLDGESDVRKVGVVLGRHQA